MIIAIEGIDGVGKTTIATKLAEELNFEYVYNPFENAFFVDGKAKFKELKCKLVKLNSSILSCWFFGLNAQFIEQYYKTKNVVCDRYLLSNMAWFTNDESTMNLFVSCLRMSKIDLLVYLTVDKSTLENRLISRENGSRDLWKLEKYDFFQNNVYKAIEMSGKEVLVINRANLDIESTLRIIRDVIIKKQNSN
ncbi:MAG: deoxynucleoside kinase [Acholeplasmatales bacterium]|nr:deoxynucleoside kinase [Acholeplasmatales bacterium]